MDVIRVAEELRPDESPLVATARALCISLDDGRWDKPPILGSIRHDKHAAMVFKSIPIPAWMWGEGRHIMVMDAIANALRMGYPGAETNIDGLNGAIPRWCGYAFIAEAWAFPNPHPHACTGDDCPYVAWVEAGRDVVDHADSIEVRQASVATEDRFVCVVHPRGSEPVTALEAPRHPGKDGPMFIEGMLPTHMWALVDATNTYLAKQRASWN